MKTTFKIQGDKADIDKFIEYIDWRWLFDMARTTMTRSREDDNTLCISLASGLPSYLKELRGYEFGEFEKALSRGCKKCNVKIVEKI